MIGDRDKALFEAGIKLGALYHQFVGVPISLETVSSLEEAIKRSISLQPYVESVKVNINKEMVSKKLNSFDYCELDGKMLSVRVVVEIGSVKVNVGLEYDKELDYPMMFVDEVLEGDGS